MKSSIKYALVGCLVAAAAAVGSNARPVQPVNRRFVLAPLASQ